MGVLPGIIGSAQAMETIKLLLGVGKSLAGRLLLFDALEMAWREIGLRRNPDCPVCGDVPSQTGLIDYEVFCGVKPESQSAWRATSGASAGEEHLTEIDSLTLTRLLASDTPPFLLDVRESWEWAVSNLSAHGARLVPLGELGVRMEEIPRDRAVVVYCRSGQRSMTAVRRLTGAGRQDVSSLRGGIMAWADEIEPDLRVV